MSFRIPPASHPAREFFDMDSVAEILSPANSHRLPFKGEALRSLRKDVAAYGFRAMYAVCLDEASDNRILIRVGAKGGWKQAWNFGNGEAA